MESRKKFEFILNGKNWSGSEAKLTLLVHSLPWLKKCDSCGEEKEHIMSSSLKGGSWGGSWLNYCQECCLVCLEGLRTSGFLKETKLLLEVNQTISDTARVKKKKHELGKSCWTCSSCKNQEKC